MPTTNGVISKDGVVRSSLPEVTIPDQDLPTYIWSKAEKYTDLPALTCGVTERSYSFAEVKSLSLRFGAALLERGLKPGDVLAIFLPNSIEYPIVILGALQAGLIVTTIDPGFKENELLQQIRTTESKVIVVATSLAPVLNEVQRELTSSLSVITVNLDDEGSGSGSTWDYREMIASSDIQRQWPELSPEAIAVLPCSSGTTSERKVVAKTHRTSVASLALVSSAKFKRGQNDEEFQRVLLVPCLLSHSAGQSLVWSALTSGTNCYILPPREPQRIIDVLAKQKPLTVTLFCHPDLLYELNRIIDPENLKSLRLITCSGCSFVSSHVADFLGKLPNRERVTFVSVLGMTEVSPLIAPLPNNLDPTILGYPMPNTELKVVSSTGIILGPNEAGELYVRGPQAMKGYFNNEIATLDAFDGDWFKTGDVVYYDEDGVFHFVGRSKDLIKIGGRSISPLDLEIVLLSHPDVADAGVIGAPDDLTGEKPIAYVVPKENLKINVEEVQEFVAARVAPHKKLSRTIVTESLPRTSTGKMLKRELKKQYSLLHA